MIWENYLTQNLTESSKSLLQLRRAISSGWGLRQVAKWVGKIARQLIIGADTKAGSIRDYKSEGEIWLWQIQLLWVKCLKHCKKCSVGITKKTIISVLWYNSLTAASLLSVQFSISLPYFEIVTKFLLYIHGKNNKI